MALYLCVATIALACAMCGCSFTAHTACVSLDRWCLCVWVKLKGREQQSSLVCEAWHPSKSACYISVTHSVSGRAAAVEQWERGEMGGCGVDRTGWGRGDVSRRANAGLKGTRKGFYYTQMIHGNFQSPWMCVVCACVQEAFRTGVWKMQHSSLCLAVMIVMMTVFFFLL